MKQSSVNSTIKAIQVLNRSIDDLKDILENDGMTHYAEQAHCDLKQCQLYLEYAIKHVNDYKNSTQLEDRVTVTEYKGVDALKRIYG